VGFVAHIKGKQSHDMVRQGLQILENLTHRGAVGADPLAGDGAGILIQVPDAFLRKSCAVQGVTLPARENTASACCSCARGGGSRRVRESDCGQDCGGRTEIARLARCAGG